MEILGGSIPEFSQKEGSLRICEDSELSAKFLLWHISVVPEVILKKNGETVIAGKDIAPLASEDAAVIVI